MKEFLGDRQITVAKEITKIHENIIKGNLDNILDKIKPIILKGEVTIVLSSEANKNKDQNIHLNKEILDLSKKILRYWTICTFIYWQYTSVEYC